DDGSIAIRAHGITPERRTQLKEMNLNIIDATCPHVGGIQGVVKQHAIQGYSIIIVGESGHPEVIGLLGFTKGRGYLIDQDEDIAKIPPLPPDKVCIVAQSTQSRMRLHEVTEKVRKVYPNALM